MTNYNEYKKQLKFATDDELSSATRQFFTNSMKSVMTLITDELTSTLGDCWSVLKAQSNGMLAVHCILSLWRATLDPMFANLTDGEQNVLKWACLLHDIAKRGTPTIQGRDFVHAFKSAAQALKVLKELGILDVPTDRQVDFD